MAKTFDVPVFYRSPIIAKVKEFRRLTDPRKRDLSPSILDFGPVKFKIARHFGFCYGVENAIEIVYRALREHPEKRIFLLSEMIHNPHVNDDLLSRGVKFLCTTAGEPIIPFDELTPNDIVVVPAFGTTIEIQEALSKRGIDPYAWNTTCPFVEKVWKKSKQIGKKDFTIILHGKRYHEETRATFSHADSGAPAVVVILDMDQAEKLEKVIAGEEDNDYFFEHFADRFSEGFDPERDLKRIGVVNQTTMLASETQAIANRLKQTMINLHGSENLDQHFADTSDTLCYATKENQDATLALMDKKSDLAIVVGGYNSSNTSHLVELCEEEMPTFYIKDANEMDSPSKIQHFDFHHKKMLETAAWLSTNKTEPVEIVLTAGASCPDALLDEVIQKVVGWFEGAQQVEAVLTSFVSQVAQNEI